MNTPDITVDDRLRLSMPWQVIFKTHRGLDYCRETRPSTDTLDEVKAWADEQCRVHGLGGAHIERW